MSEFVSFEITGINRIRNGLRTLASQMPAVVDRALGEWAKETRLDLKRTPYPPPPPVRPGRKLHRRTGRLANSWFAQRVKMGQWQIGNRAQAKGRFYAGYPVGDEQGRQAWMHEGRWWKAVDEINERLPKLRKKIEAALQREIRNLGLSG